MSETFRLNIWEMSVPTCKLLTSYKIISNWCFRDQESQSSYGIFSTLEVIWRLVLHLSSFSNSCRGIINELIYEKIIKVLLKIFIWSLHMIQSWLCIRHTIFQEQLLHNYPLPWSTIPFPLHQPANLYDKYFLNNFWYYDLWYCYWSDFMIKTLEHFSMCMLSTKRQFSYFHIVSIDLRHF